MNTKLSIVVPAFNEELRIGSSLRKILRFIQKDKLNAELIVVDDGSDDRTFEIAKDICDEFPSILSRVIRYDENRGKGYAVRKGLQNCESDIALFSDADLSTPIEEIYKLIGPIERGESDLTFGSRALDRALIGVHQPWRREQGGRIFNLVVRYLTGLRFWDTQCGFKAFNMKVFRHLLNLMEIDRFGFDVEFLFVANLRGLKLAEVPVRWNHDENTKVDVVRDSQRMFWEVMQIRRNSKQGLYSQVQERESTDLIESDFSSGKTGEREILGYAISGNK